MAAEEIIGEAAPETVVAEVAETTAANVVVEVAGIEVETEVLGVEAGAPSTLQTHQIVSVTNIMSTATKVGTVLPPQRVPGKTR